MLLSVNSSKETFTTDRSLQGGPKNLHTFLHALTLANINRFLKLFHSQNQEKIYNNINH